MRKAYQNHGRTTWVRETELEPSRLSIARKGWNPTSGYRWSVSIGYCSTSFWHHDRVLLFGESWQQVLNGFAHSGHARIGVWLVNSWIDKLNSSSIEVPLYYESPPQVVVDWVLEHWPEQTLLCHFLFTAFHNQRAAEASAVGICNAM